MTKVLLIMSMISFFAFSNKEKLLGRWESKPSVKGNVTGVVFKDSTFEGYVNKKPFVSGKYSMENNVFTFTDNGCNGKQGSYEVVFFSNDDSIRFVPITDSCIERKEGMSRLVMGRRG
jgi:hypothetical protein